MITWGTNLYQWKHFTDGFTHMEAHFQTYNKDGVDSKIAGPSFNIKFTISKFKNSFKNRKNLLRGERQSIGKKCKRIVMMRPNLNERLKSIFGCIIAKIENYAQTMKSANISI